MSMSDERLKETCPTCGGPADEVLVPDGPTVTTQAEGDKPIGHGITMNTRDVIHGGKKHVRWQHRALHPDAGTATIPKGVQAVIEACWEEHENHDDENCKICDALWKMDAARRASGEGTTKR